MGVRSLVGEKRGFPRSNAVRESLRESMIRLLTSLGVKSASACSGRISPAFASGSILPRNSLVRMSILSETTLGSSKMTRGGTPPAVSPKQSNKNAELSRENTCAHARSAGAAPAWTLPARDAAIRLPPALAESALNTLSASSAENTTSVAG